MKKNIAEDNRKLNNLVLKYKTRTAKGSRPRQGVVFSPEGKHIDFGTYSQVKRFLLV